MASARLHMLVLGGVAGARAALQLKDADGEVVVDHHGERVTVELAG